ncbi:DUF1826 domain-containing protein (plasmid) [Nitrobacteraceae bacterium UC4446_H13]
MMLTSPIIENRNRTLGEAARHVVIRPDQIGLTHILRSDINLAIWRRRVPEAISAWLAGRVESGLKSHHDDLDEDLSIDNVARTIIVKLPANDAISHAGIASLARDAEALANIFGQIADRSSLRLRLEWIAEQQCPRFHVDRVNMRLLCTYRGAATEWLANDTILTCPYTELPEHVINRLATGDVAVMKGSLHDSTAGALRHRSPPVHAPAEQRLLLVLDRAHRPL